MHNSGDIRVVPGEFLVGGDKRVHCADPRNSGTVLVGCIERMLLVWHGYVHTVEGTGLESVNHTGEVTVRCLDQAVDGVDAEVLKRSHVDRRRA